MSPDSVTGLLTLTQTLKQHSSSNSPYYDFKAGLDLDQLASNSYKKIVRHSWAINNCWPTINLWPSILLILSYETLLQIKHVQLHFKLISEVLTFDRKLKLHTTTKKHLCSPWYSLKQATWRVSWLQGCGWQRMISSRPETNGYFQIKSDEQSPTAKSGTSNSIPCTSFLRLSEITSSTPGEGMNDCETQSAGNERKRCVKAGCFISITRSKQKLHQHQRGIYLNK